MEDALRITNKKHDAKSCITDIKFAPNGKLLCCASTDNKIYLYDVLNVFRLKATCSGHGEPVSKIDFSADSKWLVSNSAGEIKYWNAKSGEEEVNGAKKLEVSVVGNQLLMTSRLFLKVRCSVNY